MLDAARAARCSRTAATGTSRTVVAVHNLAGHDVKTTLPLEEEGTLVDLLGTDDLEAPVHAGARDPYGYRWYRLAR